MSEGTEDTFKTTLDALSRRKFDVINLPVKVGYHLKGAKKIPKLTIGNEAPIEFPLPADTQVQSLELSFHKAGASNYGSGKREFLKFEAVGDDWTIKRVEHARFTNATDTPNFGAGFDVTYDGADKFLNYAPLKAIKFETRGPMIEGTEVSGAKSQDVKQLGGKKGTELPPQ